MTDDRNRTLGEIKNKVLQFFKLNDRLYEEFYSIGKQADYESRIDVSEGSGDVASQNSMIGRRFANT
jgi:hypothetical protein